MTAIRASVCEVPPQCAQMLVCVEQAGHKHRLLALHGASATQIMRTARARYPGASLKFSMSCNVPRTWAQYLPGLQRHWVATEAQVPQEEAGEP